MDTPAERKAARDAAIERNTVRVVAPVIALLALAGAVVAFLGARSEATATNTGVDYSGTIVLALIAAMAAFVGFAEHKREQALRKNEDAVSPR